MHTLTLQAHANRFLALPDILLCQWPSRRHTAIALRDLEQRLHQWGLK